MKGLNYILFGGNKTLLLFADYLIQRKVGVKVLSDEMHLNQAINDQGSLKENLDQRGVEYHSLKSLQPQFVKDMITPSTVGFSLSAIWIFKQEVISLFNNRLFNIHGALLPEDRGAGGYSWRILMGKRTSGLTVHELTTGIDDGGVFLQEQFTFPEDCKIPSDYYSYSSSMEFTLLERFHQKMESNDVVKLDEQAEEKSTYWPRLNTNLNGYINWDWQGADIERFIDAFDDPYPGASTFLKEKRIGFKKAQFNQEIDNFHPFQFGIVFRKSDSKIFIATDKGAVTIKEVFYYDSQVSAFKDIVVGDRFYTPTDILDEAKKGRVIYKSNGEVLKN